ncbi:MAG: right-handed parallel beta-helix repeat-containing protein [Thermoplasmata archaeon]|nr:right-handed parallel beta-helix repeat-containing protein [Thermoplasmata archaeon]
MDKIIKISKERIVMNKKILLFALLFCSVIFSETWYVNPVTGDDDNDGIALITPFKTVQVGLDSVNAADTLLLVVGANGDTITATDSCDMNGGLHASAVSSTPIYVLACNGSGTVYTDTTNFIITTKSTLAEGLFGILVAADYIVFQNITFDGGGVGKSEYGVLCQADGAEGIKFKRCRFINNDNHGVFYRVSAATPLTKWLFYLCEAYGNGLGGAGGGIVPTAARGNADFIGCNAHDNVGVGIGLGSSYGSNALFNNVYDNDSVGIWVSNLASLGHINIIGNVCYGNNDGIRLIQNQARITILNNVMAANTRYGLHTLNTTDLDYLNGVSYNCYYNNGTAAIDVNSGTPPGEGNVTGDPKFTSVVDGSEDFSFSDTTSSLYKTGLRNIMYIKSGK